MVGLNMKQALIKILPDKVTISEQGREASRKWQAGDKPFVQFLDDSELKASDSARTQTQREIGQVGAISAADDESSETWVSLPNQSTQLVRAGDQLSLDIGNRLEFAAPLKVNNFIIRSTTRVNLGEDPQSCETHWEIVPNDLE